MYLSEQMALGINIGAGVVAILAVIIMIISLLVSDDMKHTDNKLFLSICLSIIGVIVFDSLSELGPSVFEKVLAYKIIISLSYVLVCAYVVLFTFYMTAVLKRKAYINTNLGYTMIFIAGAMCIVWCIDVFMDLGLFVRILLNCSYMATPRYWFVAVIPMLILCFDAFLAYSFNDVLTTGQLLPWIAYAVLPCIGLAFADMLGATAMYHAEVLGLLVVFIFEHSQRQKIAALNEKQLADSKMKLMVSQIQPHFMYNSLNTIYYLIEENPEEAQEAVSAFSDYLRQNVNSLKSDNPVSFSEELSHTEAYLYLEQLRFGDKLVIEKDIKVTDFKIPPLTLQPLVENAVKHGLGPWGGAGTISISSFEDDKDYIVKVVDNGVGFDAPKFDDRDNTHTHIGIFNVYSRLKSICDGKLSVKSKPGEGTTAEIRIPKQTK